MTNTPLHAGLSCGTGSNVSSDQTPIFSPVRVILEANTTLVYVVLRVALANRLSARNELRLWFATSLAPYSSAAVGCYANKANARYVETKLLLDPVQLSFERKSDAELAMGGTYVFAWLEVPSMNVAMTVDTNLIQYP